jgi:3-hydroxyisobutyrate dehydrogenase-like beta-hydroxyacid dehydrogenase
MGANRNPELAASSDDRGRSAGHSGNEHPTTKGKCVTMKATIGFVGLGHMGGAMAARLLTAGHPVSGTSRTKRDIPGLQWLDTPRAVAEHAEVVISSVADDNALYAVADGILAGLTPGQVWVEMSTVSPRASHDLAERARARGAVLLDAPVSGSVPQVQAGTLTIMVGGDEDAYTRVEPILRELGTPHRIGGNEQGLALKLAVNISLAVQMLALAEGLLLAARSGVDRKLALDVMTGSSVGSPMLKARAPLVLHLPDEAWFDISLLHKDLELALDTGQHLNVPLPTANRADEILTVAHSLGYDHRDIAALFEVLETMAGQDS